MAPVLLLLRGTADGVLGAGASGINRMAQWERWSGRDMVEENSAVRVEDIYDSRWILSSNRDAGYALGRPLDPSHGRLGEL